MHLSQQTLSITLILAFFIGQPAFAEENGAALYKENCAVCHGNRGRGGVGVPLALPDFQYAISDQFLARTIRNGRPGRVMPAFKKLSDAQIKAIVRHIRSWAPGKPIRHPSIKVSGDPAKGHILYEKHCATCHGKNGKGGKGTGVTFSRPRDLPIIAPALNNQGFLYAASDQMIKATLMNGREGTPMVSYLKQGLSEQDINDVVSFIRSFEKQAPPRIAPEPNHDKLTVAYESPYSLKETIAALKRAIIGENFRIIRIQTLDNGLVEKTKEDPDKVIIYFCNFQLLNDALAVDPRVGLFLPCRITVVKRQGKVMVYALNPKRLSYLFNNDELNKLCDGMSEVYISIIEEATL
ncbi:Cytochrome c family protein [hydrothermal vent metagenome]|uniref:Cytochrome c family protein n=1 Tax=hydrothermal vent metagenome TaxID=652676 RepID=A0A3B1C495_9ZZZZ